MKDEEPLPTPSVPDRSTSLTSDSTVKNPALDFSSSTSVFGAALHINSSNQEKPPLGMDYPQPSSINPQIETSVKSPSILIVRGLRPPSNTPICYDSMPPYESAHLANRINLLPVLEQVDRGFPLLPSANEERVISSYGPLKQDVADSPLFVRYLNLSVPVVDDYPDVVDNNDAFQRTFCTNPLRIPSCSASSGPNSNPALPRLSQSPTSTEPNDSFQEDLLQPDLDASPVIIPSYSSISNSSDNEVQQEANTTVGKTRSIRLLLALPLMQNSS